ncbi:MAG: hypothetical protein JHD23_03205 [Akkermansiaceae bacterium]|nr:hypothetical protein [Akkermansiaceae bacterium]
MTARRVTRELPQHEGLIGPEGLFTEHKKRLLNQVLESEPTTHSGYDKNEPTRL